MSAWHARLLRLVALGLLLAAAAGVVAPTPSTSMPDRVQIPIVEPHPGGIPKAAASFRHARHAQYGCYACHPTLFPRARVGFTHADMEGGRLCASCHDGHSAFAIAGADCEWCHAPG